VNVEALLNRCVSVDLEVGPKTQRIHKFAAVHSATAETCNYSRGDLAAALHELDDYAAGAEFVLGHNLIKHDLPYLREACSTLQLLVKPPIDTLWLNPLAFPRNPYHRLVKHYKDGQLQAETVSDPELDAKLALTVFRNQLTEFRKRADSDANLLTAFHLLATSGEKPEGFESVFRSVRGRPRPDVLEAQNAIRQVLANQACIQKIKGIIYLTTKSFLLS